jgi:hypothetical protein
MKNIEESIEKLHEEFQHCGQNIKLWMRKCEAMIPEIARRNVWKKKGFENIYAYARLLAGMSRNKVNEALRIYAKGKEFPALGALLSEKGMWSVKPAFSIATRNNQEFLAEKFKRMPAATIKAFVRDVKMGNMDDDLKQLFPALYRDVAAKNTQEKANLDFESYARNNNNQQQKFQAILKSENIEKLKQLKGQRTWDEFFEDLLKLKDVKIAEEKQKIAAERKILETEKPEPIQSRSHYIPAKIDQYIEKRAILKTEEKILTGAKVPAGFSYRITRKNELRYISEKNKPLIFCECPSCDKPYDEKHHTKRFAQYHIHDPDQIYLVCQGHHDLAHLGLIANEELGTQDWQVQEKADTVDYKNYFDQRVQRFRQAAMVQ